MIVVNVAPTLIVNAPAPSVVTVPATELSVKVFTVKSSCEPEHVPHDSVTDAGYVTSIPADGAAAVMSNTPFVPATTSVRRAAPGLLYAGVPAVFITIVDVSVASLTAMIVPNVKAVVSVNVNAFCTVAVIVVPAVSAFASNTPKAKLAVIAPIADAFKVFFQEVHSLLLVS